MQNKQTVLIVEDERDLASLVNDYLEHANYNTHCIEDGSLVMEWVKENRVDLILLDLMLPNKNGLEIFKELRAFSQVPVIMATAKVDEIDRLIGLELGADDYICKPYSPREMVVRVKNVLRRTYLMPPSADANSDKLVIDEQTMQAKIHNTLLDLTPAEFRLLAYFYTHAYQIFSRDQLIDRIYSDNRIITDRTIDSHIKNLRKKMQALDPDIDYIKSVYGVGYKFEN